MGISKLIQTLQPFAERAIIDNSNPATQSSSNYGIPLPSRVTSVVIDGPSLIYHIYHHFHALKASRYHLKPNPGFAPNHLFVSQPTYSEINQATLAFIHHLQSHHGIEVQKIYFDGALPSSKRDVRLSRLEDGTRKLLELRQLQCVSFLGGCHVRSTDGAASFYDNEPQNKNGGELSGGSMEMMDVEALFHHPAPLPTTFRLLPAPPFMVPAAIEYLQSHLKPPKSVSTPTSLSTASNPRTPRCCSPIIQIVPGEADTYCAAHAKKTGAAILTSDSDLLAYDLGGEGSVILFNSLELSTPEEEQEGRNPQLLLGTRYHAPSLTSKLGISCTLQQFCFHRCLDPAISTSELKARCREPLDSQLGSGKEEAWKRFLQQYSTDDVAHADKDVDREVDSRNPRCGYKISPLDLQNLDPRVAELVTQFQGPSQRSDSGDTEAEDGDDEQEQKHALHMYLPFLLEDPSRDSTWSYGRSIRHLAYTLLQHSVPLPSHPTAGRQGRPRRMNEYQRRGTRIVGVPVGIGPDLLSHEVSSLVQSVLDSKHSYQNRSSSSCKAPNADFWKSFALSLLSEQRILNAKAPPNNAWAERYLSPANVPYTPSSWDDVHNKASLEAVLYSLRILKQIAGLVIGFSSSTGNGVEREGMVKGLVDALAGLGTIEEVMGPGQMEMGKLGEEEGRRAEGISQGRDQDKCLESRLQTNGTDKGGSFLGRMVHDSSEGLSKCHKRQKVSKESRRGKSGKKAVEKKVAGRGRATGGNRFAALEVDE